MLTCMFTCLTEFRETEDPVVDNEKNVITEKQQGEEDAADANKDTAEKVPEEKEPEEKVNCSF